MNTRIAFHKPVMHAALRYVGAFGWALLMSLMPLQAARGESIAEADQEGLSPVGTWLEHVERPPLPPLLTMQTFFADGNSLEESNSTLIRSLQHGSWKDIGHGRFSATGLSFVFDENRIWTGSTRRDMIFQLSRDGQTFVSVKGMTYHYDTDGNLVSKTPDVPGSLTARRLFSNE